MGAHQAIDARPSLPALEDEGAAPVQRRRMERARVQKTELRRLSSFQDVGGRIVGVYVVCKRCTALLMRGVRS